MRDVLPLKSSSSRSLPRQERNRVSETPIVTAVETEKERTFSFGKVLEPAPVHRPHHHELFVGVRNPGLDDTQWRKLSRGKIAVDNRLDLHGYSVQEAFDRLMSFLARARAGHWRCVEIITGLGSGEKGGTIRRELPFWLQRSDIRPFILAVVHPHQANQGSVRVLLKRNRS